MQTAPKPKPPYTPGILNARPFDEGQVVILAGGKVLVAICTGDAMEANARRIVHCCNSHDGLVKVLRSLIAAHDEEPSMLTDVEWGLARAALKLADEVR